MNIQIEDINDTRKTLRVTVGADEVEKEHGELVKDFAGMARIPGFRPGKAPHALVSKRFSREIGEELQKRVFSKAYREGLEQSKLTPMELIEAPEVEVKLGQENELTFVVDVRPEFNLPEYKGIPITRESEEVSEEEVDKALEQLRDQRADFAVVEREAKKGDYVKTSYEGKIGDQSIAELVPDRPIVGKQANTWEEVSSEEAFIPGFTTALEGMKAGDTKDVAVTFPEEFTVEELRGKEATYAVEVHEVRERVLPELTDEFAALFGVEDLATLKERVREDLAQQKKMDNRTRMREQITEKLAAAIEFPLPESAVEHETENLLRQFMEANIRRGANPEEFEKRKEELYDGARKGALLRVKTQLILARIAEAEEIKLDEKEFGRYIYVEAQRRGVKPDSLVRELKNDPEQVDAIRQSLVFNKTLDFLVENASVTDTDSQAK